MRKRLMTKADTNLLIALILLSFIAYALIQYMTVPFTAEGQVIIKADGKVVQEIALSADTPAQRINIPGKRDNAVLEIKEGRVRMLEADCPDQVCVKQGWIDRAGQSIVCVPNEIAVYLQGSADEPAEVDAITR